MKNTKSKQLKIWKSYYDILRIFHHKKILKIYLFIVSFIINYYQLNNFLKYPQP